MAGSDYRRLVAACSHDKPLFPTTKRPRKACYECVPKPEAKPRKTWALAERHSLSCQRCGSGFMAKLQTAMFCSSVCRVAAGNDRAKEARKLRCVTCQNEFATAKDVQRTWCSLECKPRALRGLFSCARCGADGKRTSGNSGKFCSRECAFAQKADDAEARRLARGPKLSVYMAGYCRTCGMAWGSRREWTECKPCVDAAKRAAACIAARALAEAKHRAAGKGITCDECACEFCPVYGSQGTNTLCVPCAQLRQRRYKNERNKRLGATHRRRCRHYGAPYRHFDMVRRVLDRDSWTCQICGDPTPRELRGTTDPKAPEVDHIVPLSAHGTPGHVPENCQCACRECNGAKGATLPADEPALI